MRDSCWFCRTSPDPSNKEHLVPDGKPLCEDCRERLERFHEWLESLR